MNALAETCPFCGAPGPGARRGRMAFDPWKGRLWGVCARCRRWSAVPLEDRWEVLEDCERQVRDHGRVVLASRHLSLVAVRRGQLVRVGAAPRVELSGWRYGDRMRVARAVGGFFRRLLGSLPAPPLQGYRPYGLGRADPPAHWVVSPFQESAWALTAAFTSVPLAPVCPSCGDPVALRPWDFHHVRMVGGGTRRGVLATCALCDRDVRVSARDVRPALRFGLGLVSPGALTADAAESAAEGIDQLGGRDRFLDGLSEAETALGEMDPEQRTALAIALDEEAELDALEAEWRDAEEVAAIMDGELTSVPGFEAFKGRVLDASGSGGF